MKEKTDLTGRAGQANDQEKNHACGVLRTGC